LEPTIWILFALAWAAAGHPLQNFRFHGKEPLCGVFGVAVRVLWIFTNGFPGRWWITWPATAPNVTHVLEGGSAPNENTGPGAFHDRRDSNLRS